MVVVAEEGGVEGCVGFAFEDGVEFDKFWRKEVLLFFVGGLEEGGEGRGEEFSGVEGSDGGDLELEVEDLVIGEEGLVLVVGAEGLPGLGFESSDFFGGEGVEGGVAGPEDVTGEDDEEEKEEF